MSRRQACELSHATICALASEVKSRSEFRQEVLLRLGEAIGCEAGLYHDAGATVPLDPRSVLGMDPAIVQYIQQGWQRYTSGLMPMLETLATRRVVVDATLMGADGLERSDFYQEIMRPNGWRATVYAHVQLRADHPPAIIALPRCRIDRKSDGETLQSLTRLLPTLSLADAALARTSETTIFLLSEERDLAQYVSNGYSNSEIAAALNQSVFTIRNKLTRIFEKYALGSRSELAHRFGRDLK
jgi:Bacterial regulatory proteins, luxR family